MLELIYTPDDASELTMRRAVSPGGKKTIVLVPESCSHSAERALCSYGGDSVSLYCEALTFRRLTTRVFAQCGGISDKALDGVSRILLMKQALDKARPSLSLYSRVKRSSSLIEPLLSLSDELKDCGISPETLMSVSRETDRSLGLKLRDAAHILSAYDGLILDGEHDPRDEPALALEKLRSSSMFEGYSFFAVGFNGFTPCEFALIKLLLERSSSFTAAFRTDDKGEYPPYIKPFRTAKRLLEYAKDMNLRVSETYIPSSAARAGSFLASSLFGAQRDSASCEGIELHRADTLFDECEFLASRVLRLLRGGFRQRDITVVVPDMNDYKLTVSSVFERCGINFYVSDKTSLASNPAVTYIIKALECICDGFSSENVFAYLKTGFSPLSSEELWAFENYCYGWRIEGSAFLSPFSRNPSGYVACFSETDTKTLAEVNLSREKAIEPLSSLKKALSAASSATEKLHVLYDFLSPLPEAIFARADALKEKGCLKEASEYERLMPLINGVFDSFARVFANVNPDTRDFCELMSLALNSLSLQSIPPYVDRVQLCTLAEAYATNSKCVLFAGINDEKVPASGKSSGLLSDYEREILDACGISLSDLPEQRLQNDYCDIYAVLTLPSDLLVLSYPVSSNSGTALKPSYLIARVKSLFPSLEESDGRDMLYRLDAPAMCREAALGGDVSARAALGIDGSLEGIPDSLEPATAAALYGDSLHLTATRVERFNSCRFSFFAQYGIRLKPRKRIVFDAPNVGTFVHYVLEGAVSEAKSRYGSFSDCPTEELISLADVYVGRYIRDYFGSLEFKSRRFVYLFNRLRSELFLFLRELKDEFSVSLFEPLDFELDFSAKGKYPPIDIPLPNGLRASLSGRIDRVDGFLHDGALYIRVLDYKTGSKSFSFRDIRNGLGLQLPVYLYALSQRGIDGYKTVPAGLLYVPSRAPVASADFEPDDATLTKLLDKKSRRSGVVISDPAILSAMDSTDKYLPVNLKKTGGTLPAEGFDALGKLAESLLRQMAVLTYEGRCETDPFERSNSDNACRNCPYDGLCGFDGSSGRDRFRSLIKSDIGELLAGEAEE